MNVQSSARRRAVLGIYGTHRKPRGGGFPLRQLECEWKLTGLRRFDLHLALKDMVQRDWLHYTQVDQQPHYELTYLGECAMHLALTGGALTMLSDWMTLRHARIRQHHHIPNARAVKNRRASDRVSQNGYFPGQAPQATGEWPLPQQ